MFGRNVPLKKEMNFFSYVVGSGVREEKVSIKNVYVLEKNIVVP